MLLIAANYKWEIIETNKFNKIENETLFFNEPKWSIFALKLQKHILQNANKYSFILHFWTCWWISSNLWEIYKIDRSFLYYLDIIENQRFFRGDYKFNSIKNNNIVTKFILGNNNTKLYDFSDIYDLETFWVAQLSNILNIPIISIKWVTDDNEIYNTNEKTFEEIDGLLNLKDNSKILNDSQFNYYLQIINNKFIDFYNWEFYDFYMNLIVNKKFKKEFIHWISN